MSPAVPVRRWTLPGWSATPSAPDRMDEGQRNEFGFVGSGYAAPRHQILATGKCGPSPVLIVER